MKSDAPLTLMCALALLSSPRVVCLVQSGPNGIRTFKRSRHRRRWARLGGKGAEIHCELELAFSNSFLNNITLISTVKGGNTLRLVF